MVTPWAVVGAIEELRVNVRALAVVLIDYDGALVATSGDERAFPESLRNGLSGRALQEAGSLMKLLQPLLSVLPENDRFFHVQVVAPVCLLAIAYDDGAASDLPVQAKRVRTKLEESLGH